MTNTDSERKPDSKQQRVSIRETTYRLVYLTLSFGAVLFAAGAVGTMLFGNYSNAYMPVVLAALLAYLSYRLHVDAWGRA